MSESLESLADRARGGSSDALEMLVRELQGKLYRLAVHMLWDPEEAKDATQEILIRIITRLDSFRGESSVQTWAYRVATNCILNRRRGRLEMQPVTFGQFGEDLEQGLAEPAPRADEQLLAEEVKIGCTLGMLLCLDRDERVSFVLGEVLELDGNEAAAVLEIEPAAFRKRLSRARQKVIAFTRLRCGIVNPANACRCRKRIHRAIALGRVVPERLLFAKRGELAPVIEEITRLDEAQRAVALYRLHEPETPDFVEFVRRLPAL